MSCKMVPWPPRRQGSQVRWQGRLRAGAGAVLARDLGRPADTNVFHVRGAEPRLGSAALGRLPRVHQRPEPRSRQERRPGSSPCLPAVPGCRSCGSLLRSGDGCRQQTAGRQSRPRAPCSVTPSTCHSAALDQGGAWTDGRIREGQRGRCFTSVQGAGVVRPRVRSLPSRAHRGLQGCCTEPSCSSAFAAAACSSPNKGEASTSSSQRPDSGVGQPNAGRHA